ncbi:MAG: hypothetical protein VX944_01680 [Myxococcota bacterium]|jgi:hypothetical protein|nr:hypothetical protein [Myxococcota bacterium]MEC9388761.1 hypothetical protein [Myxococcota bacterium]
MFLRLTAALMLLTGCANDCQQVCNEMADWAESECNREFTSEEVSSCISAYKNDEVSDAQLADCAEYKDRIDEEWTCEDIETYFE